MMIVTELPHEPNTTALCVYQSTAVRLFTVLRLLR